MTFLDFIKCFQIHSSVVWILFISPTLIVLISLKESLIYEKEKYYDLNLTCIFISNFLLIVITVLVYMLE